MTTPRVQHFIDGLVRKGLSPSMVVAIVHTVRASFRQAATIGLVATNPTAGVKLPTGRRKPVDTWTATEAATVIAHLTGQRMWSALYRLALTTGIRPGELRALRWSDIDHDAGTLHIQRTMSRDATGAVVVGDATKTGVTRRVALTPATLAALDQWRAEQDVIRLAARRWDRGDYMFSVERGKPISQANCQQQHDRIIAETGVKRIRMHGTRHTAASLLMASGENPRVVADMLGHKSTQTTLDIYTHTDERDRRKAADALQRAIEGE